MAIRGVFISGDCLRRVMYVLTFCTGSNIGGSDGVDVWGTNHWIHDVEVTNRDECVTVKVRDCFQEPVDILLTSTRSRLLATFLSSGVSVSHDGCGQIKRRLSILSVWCNQSGGSAIGSLSDGTAIENILYR